MLNSTPGMFGSVAFNIGPTPNPNAVRVGLSQILFPKATTYATAAAAEADPLAKKLFAVGGVKQVFVFNDFITVTKEPTADWAAVQPKIAEVLGEHFRA
jgi:hypothetical protein